MRHWVWNHQKCQLHEYMANGRGWQWLLAGDQRVGSERTVAHIEVPSIFLSLRFELGNAQ